MAVFKGFKSKDNQLKNIVPVGNFTLLSDEQFQGIQKSYLLLRHAIEAWKQSKEAVLQKKISSLMDQLTSDLYAAYASLAGRPYLEAQDKSMYYPSFAQLQAETWYYRLPIFKIMMIAYGLSLILLTLSVCKEK